MIAKGIEHSAFHKGIAKGLIAFIPKEEKGILLM
jgi:hypothetical protein